jgi:hypothetical protein
MNVIFDDSEKYFVLQYWLPKVLSIKQVTNMLSQISCYSSSGDCMEMVYDGTTIVLTGNEAIIIVDELLGQESEHIPLVIAIPDFETVLIQWREELGKRSAQMEPATFTVKTLGHGALHPVFDDIDKYDLLRQFLSDVMTVRQADYVLNQIDCYLANDPLCTGTGGHGDGGIIIVVQFEEQTAKFFTEDLLGRELESIEEMQMPLDEFRTVLSKWKNILLEKRDGK